MDVFYQVLIFLAGIIIGLLIGWIKNYFNIEIKIQYFDQEEFHENCTVHVLSNSKNGETSIGWWEGSIDDMPVMHTKDTDDEDDE